MRHLIIAILVFLVPNTSFSNHFSKALREKPKSIKLIYDSIALRIPGARIKVGVEVLTSNSAIKRTKNLGGKLGMRNFTFQIQGGRYKSGYVYIDDYNFSGDLSVIVNARKFPDVSFSKDLAGDLEQEILFSDVPIDGAAPGDKFQVNLSAKFKDGTELGIGTKTLPYDNYSIEVQGGVFKEGVITISEDISEISNHEVYIQIKPKSGSSVSLERYYPLDYIKDYRFSAYGIFGSNGFSGRSGSCASSIGNDPHGESGRDGEHGEDGEKGPDLDIYLSIYYDDILKEEMLLAELIKNEVSKYYLINPEGGNLQITSAGGNGGDGGDGGDGGNGAAGYDGEITTRVEWLNDSTYQEVEEQQRGGQGGYGGEGGYGGDGGYGGGGGDIYVYFTPQAEKFLHLIKFNVKGGTGGSYGSGGNAGNGGTGGAGWPRGQSGENGNNGRIGESGYDGNDGNVFFEELKGDK